MPASGTTDLGHSGRLFDYPLEIFLVGWTVAVPLVLMVLAFLSPRARTIAKLQIAGLLILSWLVTSVVISATNRPLLQWEQGLMIVMVATIGNWVALHRMMAGLGWRYGWLLHQALVLVFGAFLFLQVAVYGFGTSHHY